MQSYEVSTLHVVNDLPGAAFLVLVESGQLTFLHLLCGIEISRQTALGEDSGDRLTIVGIVCLNSYIVDLRTYAKCDV